MAENINKTKEKEIDAPIEREYFFPQHGKTVKAVSKEDAEKKVAEIIKAVNK